MGISCGMTRLARYLQEQSIPQKDFADMLGVSQGMVSRMASGSKRPSLFLAVKIERATGGNVPVESWVNRAFDNEGTSKRGAA